MSPTYFTRFLRDELGICIFPLILSKYSLVSNRWYLFFFHLTINKGIIDNLHKESLQKWKGDTYFGMFQNGIGETYFGTEGLSFRRAWFEVWMKTEGFS